MQSKVLQNLKDLEGAPSVPFHEVPKDFYDQLDVEAGIMNDPS